MTGLRPIAVGTTLPCKNGRPPGHRLRPHDHRLGLRCRGVRRFCAHVGC